MERFQEFSRVRYIKSTSEGKCRLSNPIKNLPRILFPSRLFQSLTQLKGKRNGTTPIGWKWRKQIIHATFSFFFLVVYFVEEILQKLIGE
jgi:hypothetical protein